MRKEKAEMNRQMDDKAAADKEIKEQLEQQVILEIETK